MSESVLAMIFQNPLKQLFTAPQVPKREVPSSATEARKFGKLVYFYQVSVRIDPALFFGVTLTATFPTPCGSHGWTTDLRRESFSV